jgi:hypothetical protein
MATKKPAPKRTVLKSAEAPTGPSKTEQARWRAEDDLRTMQRMAELKKDSSRIRAAEKLLNEQMSAVKAVKGK